MVVRLPRPLVPPASREGPEFAAHLDLLRGRLRVNPHHKLTDLEGEGAVERAIERLDEEAVRIARTTASQVFVSTAVSQSGRLDTFLVLSMQTRMVWKIARLYNQRPSLREMVHLYANVAGTAFVAGEIQDVDLSEQIEPVFSAVIGSLGGAVPGFQARGVDPGQLDPERSGRRVPDVARGHDREAVLRRARGGADRDALRGRRRRKRPSTSGRSSPKGPPGSPGPSGAIRKSKVGDAAKDAYSKVLTVFDKLKKRSQAEALV